MNKLKFSLADVLTVLAALTFGFVCYLSVNFYTLGNTVQSVAAGVFTGIVLGGTALGATLFKRTNRNFKTRFKCEIAFLVLFAVFAILFACVPFPHYFVVSGQKAKIQEQFSLAVNQTEEMFDNYEKYAEKRVKEYEYNLSEAINIRRGKIANPSLLKKYGFVEEGNPGFISYPKQKDKKIESLHKALPHSDSLGISFDEMKKSSEKWSSDVRKNTKGWESISVVDIVSIIHIKPQEWKGKLIELSRYDKAKGEIVEEFKNCDISATEVEKYFTTLSNPKPLTIGLAVFAYALMLLSYFISRRSTKTTIGTTNEGGKFDIKY